MALGGKRPGAGRPPGTPNKSNALRMQRAAREGPLPHEIMLRVARNLVAVANRYKPVEVKETDEDGREVTKLQFAAGNEDKYIDLHIKASEAAARAAPYYAPRLSAVKISQEVMDVTKLTDEELAVFERAAERLAREGANLSTGTGETRH